MAALNWNTPYTALGTALSGATGMVLARGTAIREWLLRVGTPYTAQWSTAIDNAKTAYFASAASITAAHNAQLGAIIDAADEAARYAESLQESAQSADEQRYVANEAVLASTKAIAFDDAGPATSTAALNLLASATPVLRVEAKDAGTPGNRVEASFTAGGLLLARLGSYVESYGPLVVGQNVNVASSKLLSSANWFPSAASVPDVTAYTALTGGSGGGLQAVRARLERAIALPAASGVVEDLRAHLATIADAALPLRPETPTTGSAAPYASDPMFYLFRAGDRGVRPDEVRLPPSQTAVWEAGYPPLSTADQKRSKRTFTALAAEGELSEAIAMANALKDLLNFS